MRLRLLLAWVFAVTFAVGLALLFTGAPLRHELEIFGIAVLIGIAIGLPVSQALVKPLRELARASTGIARGEFGAQVSVTGADEVGRIAGAINRLSAELRHNITDADASRDEVRNSVRRLGEALRSTGPRDLGKLLSVVLETALVAVEGKSGAVFLLSANRSDLYIKIGRHLDPEVARRRIPVGNGIVGWVAQNRRSVLLPSGPDGPVPVDPEPTEATVLAVPLETQTQLLGVLALYGHKRPGAFGADDLDIIDSLARQACVGIDNVLLHQEAERLSITDGLTGVWNRRYFQIQLGQDFQRALRWGRPLSLLMIDLDRFKKVNDRHGHQRGDAILIELAQRVVSHVRHGIDTFARYGGEEFVLILPETGTDGAHVAAEKIRQEIAAAPFGGGDEAPVDVTVSIGYAVFPQQGPTPQVLAHAADLALYAAKARGRDRVVGAQDLEDVSSLAVDPTRS